MIGRRKKQLPVRRSPHLEQQKQSTFHYSSNRSQVERSRDRGQGGPDENESNLSLPQTLRRLPYTIFILIILTAAVYLSLLTGTPKVIIDHGQQPLRPNAEYELTAKNAATGVLAHSKFTLNRQKIAQELQNKYPEFTTVDVQTPLFSDRTVITATSSQPAVILRAHGQDFVVDTRGRALFDVKQINSGLDTASLPVVVDQSGTPITVGKTALTASQIKFITEVRRQAEAKQMTFDSLTLSAGGGELHIKYSGLPYYVKFNLYEEARTSFGTFIAAREHAERSNLKPVEYIDVRIPGRAYIK